MTRTRATRIAIAVSTFACAALFSFTWTEEHGVSMSVDSAQARVGRPLTPVSVAGVARRQTRRAAYGAAAVGAGAVAVGTGAAIAATSPGWGWGTAPYYTGAGYTAGGGPYAAYGYSAEDWRKRNGMVCAPGTLTKMDDGRMYRCQ
ncbi:hypothetical protein [Bradyrhizobium iriomotense]|uniref:Uncharacterized protein n=1 Tax=Bradyrhizobium iriomotense TaxID=441950 RepID=A0ABQ6AQB8_9BRAD|nr:hypothetical protein [Bradyrhizobium iriomotense]GLR84155.1 hypothetical protein GCM10007857_08650 [Bradyrhizobium iriomotense]